jgi:PleD family two-component response regulator
VLLLGGDVAVARRVRSLFLGDGGRLAVAADLAEARVLLDQELPDVLLIYEKDGGHGAASICRSLRAAGRWEGVPIVILPAVDDASARLAAYGAGADDYLPLDLPTAELFVRLLQRAERFRSLRGALSRPADPGLLARATLTERLAARAAHARVEGRPVGLALVAANGLRNVVAQLGGTVGQEVMDLLAGTVRHRMRRDDAVGRWDDQTLAIAVDGCSPGQLTERLGALGPSLTRGWAERHPGLELRFALTAGIATIPDDADTLDRLVETAQTRLDAATRNAALPDGVPIPETVSAGGA